MLDELKRTLNRLQESEPFTSPLLILLSRHCDSFTTMIERVRECDNPHVKRILAEEAFEFAGWIMRVPTDSTHCVDLEETEPWLLYLEAAETGQVIDYYYHAYVKAKRFVEKWLEHSYIQEIDGPDYKSKRYAYALSNAALPEWFDSDLLVPRLEAIVTAYCNMLITILDYAAENDLKIIYRQRRDVFIVNVQPVTDNEEYLTPEIGQVLPALDETCAMLTQKALITALTEQTKEWVKGDPELADNLLEKKKTLEECVRYIMEKAAAVAKTNAEAMTKEQLESVKHQVHGKQAFMAGFAITADQVFAWAKDYYFNPDVKPAGVTQSKNTKSVEKAGAKPGAKAGSKPAANGKTTAIAGTKPANTAAESAPKTVDGNAIEAVEQTSLFGSKEAA